MAVILRDWILAELDGVEGRLRTQVLDLIPTDRRRERPGGGNSVAWATLHIARHAELGIAILGGPEPTRRGPFGLGETEPETWAEPVDATAIERYAMTTISAARTLLQAIDPDTLDESPLVAPVLEQADVPLDQFGWLYRQWVGKPRSFFVSWSLVAHQTNHIGEMIATRNRMGLSPYSQ